MPSPVAAAVVLTDDERAQLEAWGRRPKSAQALALRSRIVLAAADGLGNTAIAGRLGIAVSSARKWRSRFLALRLDGLTDEPRPGRPRTVTDEQVEAVIARDAGERAGERDALVDPVAGRRAGPVAVGGVADLAGVRAAAAPAGVVEAEPRPVIHRQSPGRCRPVPGSARAGGGHVRGLEKPDPGPGPHRPDLPDDARRARQGHPRLQAGRHLEPVRGAGPGHRPGDRIAARTAPGHRVPQVPGDHRPLSPGRSGRARRPRQRLHPQDASDQAIASSAQLRARRESFARASAALLVSWRHTCPQPGQR